jgi:hypothetical protein
LVGPISDCNVGQSYYGFVLGTAPVSIQVTYTTTPAPAPGAGLNGNYIVQATSAHELWNNAPNAYQQITFYLQYWNPVASGTGTWVTYDVKYPDLHGLGNAPIIADPLVDYTSNYKNPLSDNEFYSHATGFDPRSARWGIGTSSEFGFVSTGTFGNQTASDTFTSCSPRRLPTSTTTTSVALNSTRWKPTALALTRATTFSSQTPA